MTWPVIGLVLNVILSVSLINLMRFTNMNTFLHLGKAKATTGCFVSPFRGPSTKGAGTLLCLY